uniref:Helicase ATP-binding domain-containing protein n=1 Tax=viral metagenome TaxID=1070528 RepID=A0A6C0BMV6_9ZZZZ
MLEVQIPKWMEELEKINNSIQLPTVDLNRDDYNNRARRAAAAIEDRENLNARYKDGMDFWKQDVDRAAHASADVRAEIIEEVRADATSQLTGFKAEVKRYKDTMAKTNLSNLKRSINLEQQKMTNFKDNIATANTDLTKILSQAQRALDRIEQRAEGRSLSDEGLEMVERASYAVTELKDRAYEVGEALNEYQAEGSYRAQEIQQADKVLQDQMDFLEDLETREAELRNTTNTLFHDFRDYVEAKVETVEVAPGCSIDRDSRPCVIIYDRKPPVIDLKAFRSCDDLQRFVAKNFARFKWEAEDLKPMGQGKCDVIVPTPSQLFGYHYFQPFNESIYGVLIDHSAGSGKTALGTLIMSIFARVGYRIMMVATKQLLSRNPYLLEAAFQQNMDFNIQQYIHVKGVSSILELYNQENPNQRITPAILESIGKQGTNAAKRLQEFGINIWSKQMNIRFSEVFSKRGYEELGRAARADYPGVTQTGAKTIKQWSQLGKAAQPYNPEDPWGNVFVLIDEAHKFMDTSFDQNGNFLMFTLACWRSYAYHEAHPEHRSIRVLLMTATPMVNHPVDLINLLNCTVSEDRAIKLLTDDEYLQYAGLTATEYRRTFSDTIYPAMIRNFEQTYVEGDRITNLRPIQELLNGHISYLNVMGDANHFATPQIVYVDVNYSPTQEQDVRQCFEQHTSLKYDRRTGLWMLDETKTDSTQSPRKTVQYDWDEDLFGTPSETLWEDEDLDDAGLARGMDKKKKRAVEKCLRQETIFPSFSGTRKRTQEMNRMKKQRTTLSTRTLASTVPNVRKAKQITEKYSPLLSRVFGKIEALRTASIRKFRDDRIRIHQIKQILFVDTKDTRLLYFVANWFAAMYGYTVLNPAQKRNESKVERQRVDHKKTVYKNILVLHEGLKTDKKALRAFVAMFNSKENHGGKLASLVVYGAAFKEGLSLKGVGAIHIAGLVMSRADLAQAIARGIRNCSHKGFPFPWHVKVYIYYSYLSYDGDMSKATMTPQQLLNELVSGGRRGELLIQQMQTQLEDCAYDRLLTQAINASSRDIEETFQLSDPGAPPGKITM